MVAMAAAVMHAKKKKEERRSSAAQDNALRISRVAFGSRNERAARIQSIFQHYDTNQSGYVEKDEVVHALADLDIEVSAEQVQMFMHKFGRSERLNEKQFGLLIGSIHKFTQRKAKLEEALLNQASGSSRFGLWSVLLTPSCLPWWPYQAQATQVYQNKYVQGARARAGIHLWPLLRAAGHSC